MAAQCCTKKSLTADNDILMGTEANTQKERNKFKENV